MSWPRWWLKSVRSVVGGINIILKMGQFACFFCCRATLTLVVSKLKDKVFLSWVVLQLTYSAEIAISIFLRKNLWDSSFRRICFYHPNVTAFSGVVNFWIFRKTKEKARIFWIDLHLNSIACLLSKKFSNVKNCISNIRNFWFWIFIIFILQAHF